jgi:hypothetical protein
MSRELPITSRHVGEARYRGRILQHQLDRLQASLMRVAGGEAVTAETWIRELREQLTIVEDHLTRWRAEQRVERGGQGPLRD